MPDFVSESFAHGQELHLDRVFWRLILSFLFGVVIAGIYWVTHRRDKSLSMSFVSTLVLLAILVSMVTQVIGDNVARAFSLVGALSIVRFRTVVEDTRDTAFVIFAVIVGMAVGANHAEVALAGLAVVGVAAVLTKPRRAAPASAAVGPFWELRVRVGIGQSLGDAFGGILEKHCSQNDLLTTATARQGASMESTYKICLRPSSQPTAVVGELNRVDGMQSVELRRI